MGPWKTYSKNYLLFHLTPKWFCTKAAIWGLLFRTLTRKHFRPWGLRLQITVKQMTDHPKSSGGKSEE